MRLKTKPSRDVSASSGFGSMATSGQSEAMSRRQKRKPIAAVRIPAATAPARARGLTVTITCPAAGRIRNNAMCIQSHQPGGPQPKEAWGFEKRVCSVCGEIKGGNPFRLCRCQRAERGLAEVQPHTGGASNPMCDGAGPCDSGSVRVLPMGANPDHGNLILCLSCFQREMAFRRERNRELSPDCAFDLPAWTSLKIYKGA